LESNSESEVLNLDEIKKDVERDLKQANIKTLSDVEFIRAQGRPLLLVKVNGFKRKDGYICSIYIHLYQHVYLMHKPQSETYPAATWSSDGVIVVMSALENIRALVKDETAKFIKAYLAVNQE